MTDLQRVISDNRDAVTNFIAAAHAVQASLWETPRAPGKWSPRQVTEHVTLAYELSRAALHGTFPGRAAPRFLRPLIRKFFLNPVLKAGRFGKGTTAPGPFRPTTTASGVEPLTARLRAAAIAFESDLLAGERSGGTTVNHPFFGTIPVDEYLRLQVIHTRHHQAQLAPIGN